MPSLIRLFRQPRFLVLLEIMAIFGVLFLYGSRPVPDSNEAHYLAKAIHFWNPDWGGDDFFLNSKDPHLVFCFAFGWLSRWLSPVALVWVGRVATWWLLAWAWRRLNGVTLGRRWWSIATAAATLWLMDHFAMAGEWFVGGIEAKGFAYVFVLLGLEALVGDAWRRAWFLFGGAAMIHVLVGGWAVVAAGLAWLVLGHGHRPTLRSMLPALLGGLALSLPGLICSLRLTWGVDPRVVDLADQIYVFERLGHHLFPAGFSVLWFSALLFVWLAVRWQTPETHAAWRLHAFVVGTIFISLAGFAIAYATAGRPALAAQLLRFYWFRLTDVMVPLGVAVGGAVLVDHARARKAWISPAIKTMLLILAVWQVGQNGYEQIGGRPMRNLHEPEESHFDDWREACRWIATSGRIPADARFLTPRACRTFKWYTGRAEVVNWKDIPQDPRSIVEWWRRHQMLHATGGETPRDRWFTSLADRGEDRLIELGRYYRADYVLTESWPPLALPVVFANDSFVVYRLSDSRPDEHDDE